MMGHRRNALRSLAVIEETLDNDNYHGLQWAIDEIRSYLEKEEND